MKLALCIFLMLLSLTASSQDWLKREHNFKLYMCIKEVIFDSTLVSLEGEVIWGTDRGDTTCFLFNGEKIKCFYPISKKLYRKRTYPTNTEINKFIETEYGDIPSENVFLRQDRYNELYIIRFSEFEGELGLMIWITNYDYGTPSYVLSWPVEILPSLKPIRENKW